MAGGDSREHDVSLRSAAGLYEFIPNTYRKFIVMVKGKEWKVVTGPIDHEGRYAEGPTVGVDKNDFSFIDPVDNRRVKLEYAYITIHGTPGENGLLQGYLRMMGIPFSSCDVMQAALTFNKYVCNCYLKSFGIRVADNVPFDKRFSTDYAGIIDRLGLPLFVKPMADGSSFGVSKVRSEAELMRAMAAIRESDSTGLVESFLDGVEVTCGMYCVNGQERILPVYEVNAKNDFFDYNAKYKGESNERPARLAPELLDRIRQTTSYIYKVLNAHGLIRVDYIITEGDVINMLEVNTTPGMTLQSFVPQMIRSAGWDIHEVMHEIIENRSCFKL